MSKNSFVGNQRLGALRVVLVVFVVVVFINLTHTTVIWEEEPHLRKPPSDFRLPVGKSVMYFIG